MRIEMTKDDEIKRLKKQLHFGNTIMHNMIVANQSAWLEWKEGKGAEKAMEWIENGLDGPGHIPDNTEHKTPQKWLDSNVVEHHEHTEQ
jgi:hypothetical protein